MKILYLQQMLHVYWSLLHVSASEEVLLNSTLNRARVAYEGQRIIFTCVTRNSLILQWRSDQYIGTGDSRLEIYSSGPEDFAPSNVDSNIFARRINTSNDNGVPVIKSELHLKASLQHKTATVICDNNGHGERKNITFQTIGEVLLDSTLNGAMTAYGGQRIIFRCMTRNSVFLRWKSDQYIGAGNHRLQFNLSDPNVSVSINVDSTTFARKIGTYNDGGVPIIESELHLIASLQHQTATITCEHNGHGETEDSTFHLIESGDVLLDSTLNEVRIAYEGQRIIFHCATGDSLILQWRSDQYIGTGDNRLQLFSSGPGLYVSSPIDSNTFAQRINASNDGGIPVIESELQLEASLQHPTATVICDNVDHEESKNVTFQTVAMPRDYVTLTVSLNESQNGMMVAYGGQRIIFTCVTRNTYILQWRSDQYIGPGDSRLEIYSSGSLDIANSTIYEDTYARRLNTTSNNVPEVIVSELYLTASVHHPISTVTCANNGQGRNKSITVRTMSSIAETTGVEATTSSVESRIDPKTTGGVYVAEANSVPVYAIIIPVAVIIIVIIIIIIIVLISFMRKIKTTKVSEGDSACKDAGDRNGNKTTETKGSGTDTEQQVLTKDI